ncbi:MAG: 16S rRNA (cytidine(1402)-2'-O)-methyltransferase [Microcystis wesenbergii Mw_MB_S_20031200_S109]|uniref:Ribosomal RNA small subunit methyltransferase I n=1 Tax=Microcystis wesenbergii Mw_MB_S_20031200_S109D TaxID=2486241 RepID=A0A552LVE0_9CHRO|nr:MAG: 16S rRNA (cytidine(1402)-2'-O)-methyltransferase [Microcystis wesenbergii Mw_MB_S_20031200_S109]TRV24183.1 MAG: 16S rRNA (cytidine(1402)-2'-O)-methyltransferase [Microcystis wesenbergii Mw_MB_S_20031200_S109D]
MNNIGKLYVVGTPIGNLDDLTFRSLATLKKVSLIAAEDTRHTGKLLQHFDISTPQISYHEHNRLSRLDELLNILSQGEDIALVTDAGMPGISDPGYELIKACIETNIEVVPIPGVTAVITALAVSGLPTERFCFEGFLPGKEKLRQERLDSLKTETRTMVFYEAPHKLIKTLEDLRETFGPTRKIVLGRELTKLYEEIWRGTIAEAINLYRDNKTPKGEFTIVVMGNDQADNIQLSDEELKRELKQIIERGVSRSQASRQLAQVTNLSRSRLYKLALEI